ncbi:MAG: glycosyltransferase [Hyphomicrobiaceae bacterium]
MTDADTTTMATSPPSERLRARFTNELDSDFIAAYFAEQSTGTFLDVGAWNATDHSLTRRLYEGGFKGLLIEASPSSFAAIRSVYAADPEMETMHACVGARSGPTTFWDARGDGMATVMIERMTPWRDAGIAFDPIAMTMQTPHELLATSKHRKFDFVSIDTGGTSQEILLALDLGETGTRLVSVDRNGSDFAVCALHCRRWGLEFLLMSSDNFLFGVPNAAARAWLASHPSESPAADRTLRGLAGSEDTYASRAYKKPAERLVLCAGIHRSGSTFLFNVAHEVLSRTGKPVCAEWILGYNEQDPAPIHLVKLHDPAPWLEDVADVVFTSRRDLRDIVASLDRMNLAQGTDEHRQVAMTAAELHRYWAETTAFDFAYEEVMADRVGAVEQMARILGVPLTRAEAEDALANIDNTIKNSSSSHWDSATLLHPNHRGGGDVMGWRLKLPRRTIEAIEETCGDWLDRYGYPRAATLPRLPPIEKPVVSVLMPVYNAAPYLAEAIESILLQSFVNFELVIQDDASTDASRDIAARYAAGEHRIVILPPFETNRGEAAARTALLAAARGKFIAWMDSDDVSTPERLATQLEFLELNPDIAAVGSGIALTDGSLNVIERRTFDPDPVTQAERPDICCASLMLRAAPARETGAFKDVFFAGAGDGEWLLRFMDKHRVTNIANVLYYYRRHAGSTSHDFAHIRRLGMLAYYATRERRAGRIDPIDALAPDRDFEFLRDDVFLDHGALTIEEKLQALTLPLKAKPRLVSVLIPFQDDHLELYHALASLAVQSFHNFEVVIFDNASTPALDAAEINLANYDFRARIVRSDTRLRGYEVCQKLVEAAEGRFILWQPAASYARNDRIEAQVKYLIENADCNAVGTGVNFARTELSNVVSSVPYRTVAFEDGKFEGAPYTFMIRREALEKAGPYRASDWFPLDSDEFLRRIEPQGSVHNFYGFMLQVYPDRPLLDPMALWADWQSHHDAARAATAADGAGAPAIHRKPIAVRLISDWDGLEDALDRLLPGSSRRWKNVEFVVEEGRPVDYHLFLQCPRKPFHLVAPPNRIWFGIGEPPTPAHMPLHRASGRGTVVMSCAESIAELAASEPRRYIPAPAMTPTWSVKRSWDHLAYAASPDKTGGLSWVTSALTHLPGHRYRMEFLERLRTAEVPFDLFGRGFTPIEDKWDGIAPYRYSVAFENFRSATYFTEKLMDCFVGETLPLYYGCTSIADKFPDGAVWLLDPEDPHIVEKIRDLIGSQAWQERLPAIREAKQLTLTRHNMFMVIADIIAADTSTPDAPRAMVLNPVATVIQ